MTIQRRILKMELGEPVEFEWDEGNLDKNFIKHGVTNQESEDVFTANRFLMLKDKLHSGKENRYMVVGPNRQDNVLTLIITLRGKKVRVISARPAGKKERRFYEETFEDSKI